MLNSSRPCTDVHNRCWLWILLYNNRTSCLNYLVFFVKYRFSEVTQRMFKYNDIQDHIFTPDKNWTFRYIERLLVRHHIQKLHKLLTWSSFWAHVARFMTVLYDITHGIIMCINKFKKCMFFFSVYWYFVVKLQDTVTAW